MRRSSDNYWVESIPPFRGEKLYGAAFFPTPLIRAPPIPARLLGLPGAMDHILDFFKRSK